MHMDLLSIKIKTGRKKSGGDKKHGRNKLKCSNYRKFKWLPNKLRKIERHIKIHPLDNQARGALMSVKARAVNV